MKFEKIKDQISLHGLGFLQVALNANQRIHVWHPELPRRKCFKNSSIHDHRFGFISKVLVGTQINQLYKEIPNSKSQNYTHVAYLHEGERSKYGNRPWIPDYYCRLEKVGEPRVVKEGEQYEMNPFMLHSTDCEGITVTLMTKTHQEVTGGAHSYCSCSVEPDVDFNRHILPKEYMWEIFADSFKL